MSTFIESLATAVLLILIVILLLHAVNGTALKFVKSNVTVTS